MPPASQFWLSFGQCAAALTIAVAPFAIGGCEEAYPEVILVNRIEDRVLIKQLSFNGCLWDAELANGDATSVGRCLPGTDRIHFKKFDPVVYVGGQLEAGELQDFVAATTASDFDVTSDVGSVDGAPVWFNYQTRQSYVVEYGDVRRIEITRDSLEQDFSIPGPYGH